MCDTERRTRWYNQKEEFYLVSKFSAQRIGATNVQTKSKIQGFDLLLDVRFV